MDNTISAGNSKKELMALLLAEKGVRPIQEQRITRSQRGESIPLSFGQERLWFLDQLEPGNSVNNIPTVQRLRGRLDAAVLERSIAAIIQRHESLRTIFVDREGRPAQVIVPTVDFALVPVDLLSIPPDEQARALRQVITAEARHSFDLSGGPLIRSVLVQVAPDEHVFLLTMHHIVSDGWSIDVFMRELSLLYSGFLDEQGPVSLPELGIQYADYAVWQRDWLQGVVLEEQLAYWKEQLRGAPPLLELPTDRPRPAVQTHRGAYLPFALAPSLAERLKALSRREGTTLFMTLLAAFQLLLARYSGQEDIVVGTPVAGRNRSEFENLIGFFLNNLALRCKITGDAGFRDVLQQVRQVTLDAYAHQDVPFEHVLQALEVERISSHTPLFQVFFNMQNFVNTGLSLPGVAIETIPPRDVESKFDLTLYVEECKESIHLNLLYNEDLFHPERMEQMLDQYQILLEQIVSEPEERIGNFSLVTPMARNVLPDATEALNDEWYGPVYARIASYAQHDPRCEAIRDASGSWNYAQLQERSNQVAHFLIDGGLRKGNVVAVYGYRCATLVCALIGILKAGAAFCILDPAYPSERLVDYLEALSPRGWLQIVEAGPLAVEVQDYLAGDNTLCLLELSAGDGSCEYAALQGYATDDPEVTIGPDDLAVISFTSGSTGKPKGVLGRHGPLSHFLPWQQQTYGFHAEDRYSMLSGLSHDPLQREMFTPLWLGATICIPTAEERSLPGKLAAWMRREEISIAHLTPAMMQLLTQKTEKALPLSKMPSLRALFITGDMVTMHDLRKVSEVAPNAIFVNSYGSTETQRAVANFIASNNDVFADEDEPLTLVRATVPVGRGIQDVQLLILNDNLHLTGIGEVGEICVRSPHLSAGYLHDLVLTRQRFVVNPFTNIEGDRLYRTGDLGRYLPNGIVDVLGRRDQQAKIRGFRVELGEIEAALKRYQSVRECLVVVREDVPGDKRLIAYIVSRDGKQVTGKDLYRFLKRKLPDYMLPAAFVGLERLPVTPNGKVDRKALPPPRQEVGERRELHPARSPIEELLVTIWSQVLETPAVGIEESFFELGGHSLLATQVISRVRDAFQIELPLRCLFETPTVAGLAEQVSSFLAMKTGQGERAIERVSRERELPLSFAQQRLWFLDQLQPGDASYNVHVGLRLDGKLERRALERSLNEIVNRHEGLRTIVANDGAQPRQIICVPEESALPYRDLRQEMPDGNNPDWNSIVSQLAFEEAQCPFDLARGPLFRSLLLSTGSEEHILLLTMHHIVSDGWSINVLIKELMAFYIAFCQEEPVSLPELGIQYADYAVWQRDWLQGAVLEEQLAYWKEQLRGAPPLLELPTDRPRPAVQTHRGAYLPFALAPSLAERLKALSRREGTTLFMTLLAAFQLLLARYSGQEDIVVGTPVAGRNRSEFENLIGFFVNTLVIRTQISGEYTFQQLLQNVRAYCLDAYVHQDLPFERLVEELHPERALGINPLFQVMFVMQDAQLEKLELPGLAVNALETERGTARFDMLLSCADTSDGLEGYFQYNTDLFDGSTIERMKNHLVGLLEAVVAEPERSLCNVSLLSEDERRTLLMEWNATRAEWPDALCLSELFEQQVLETPHATAVVYGEQQLTYRELDQRANQLAHLLQERGVGPEVRVGLYLERSLDLPIAIFGVLKAGGVYVPIDPSYPGDRAGYMLQDAEITTIIAPHQAIEKLAGDGRDIRVICLDCEGPALDRQSTDKVVVSVDPENLAYILYTSGSTGMPKGTMITHRGLVNYLSWSVRRYAVARGAGAPVHSSLSFDLTVTSLFSPLLAGRAVYLLPPEKSIEGLGEVCCSLQKFSLIKITPSHLALLSQFLETCQRVTGTECFVIGGEQLLGEKLAFWRELAPGTRFINEYGPTETVVGCCVYEVPDGPPEAGPVPIGRPIANTELYLLDQDLQPVPVGFVGELYIAGIGLARGYLHRPALTAERFIPHPFSAQAGARLYKTGDLARYRPDGVLEFLGRNDHQVKLRGFRIELGEIENTLSHHLAVRDAAVMIREDRLEDKRLVAYITLRSGLTVTTDALRAFLEQRLPTYMVPSRLLILEELPLTSNGKVEYRQLPAPEEIGQERGVTSPLPQTAIEQSIASLWQDVLQMQKVGVHDNFFDLGGHSLLITQVYRGLDQRIQAEITLIELFQYPTIHSLAERIGQKIGKQFPARKEDARAQELAAGKDRSKQRLKQRLQRNIIS